MKCDLPPKVLHNDGKEFKRVHWPKIKYSHKYLEPRVQLLPFLVFDIYIMHVHLLFFVHILSNVSKTESQNDPTSLSKLKLMHMVI